MSPFRLALTASLIASMAGCAVGPDFLRPSAPSDHEAYDNDVTVDTESANDPHGATQSLLPGASLPAKWWQLFQSEPLNGLIEQSLLHNPDIQAADAALRAAQEDLYSVEGYLLPTVSGDFSSKRQKISGASNGGIFPGSIYTVHNASVSASYGVDLFGGTRRAVEEYEAQRDYQAFELEAAKLSLTSNVVTTAITEASLRGQIEAQKRIIAEEEHSVQIAKAQLDAGAITRLAYLSELTTLAQSRTNLPPLAKQLSQTRHALAVLTGELPSHQPAATFDLTTLHLPEKLPLTLPSKLVEQRPDIRAAEANLHAASAAIGVAEAARFPQITLSADIGSVANKLQNLFTPGGGIWSFGGGLSQTIFDAGTLAHKQGSAEAKYDQAAAIYRKTVLGAFQEVADTLRAIDEDAKTLKEAVVAEQAASESLKLARDQYKAGSISYLSLIDSVNAEQKSLIALIQAEAQRFADTAALFQALGGGWMTSISTEGN